jgi:hypothetical protein
MHRIFAVYSDSTWYFRALGSDTEVKVSRVLALCEARRIAVPELDRAFGRKGWTFIY